MSCKLQRDQQLQCENWNGKRNRGKTGGDLRYPGEMAVYSIMSQRAKEKEGKLDKFYFINNVKPCKFSEKGK